MAGFSVLLAAGGVALAAPTAMSATSTMVALTFDNDTNSQYTLGYISKNTMKNRASGAASPIP